MMYLTTDTVLVLEKDLHGQLNTVTGSQRNKLMITLTHIPDFTLLCFFTSSAVYVGRFFITDPGSNLTFFLHAAGSSCRYLYKSAPPTNIEADAVRNPALLRPLSCHLLCWDRVLYSETAGRWEQGALRYGLCECCVSTVVLRRHFLATKADVWKPALIIL